jgi:hypothetical protein
MISGIIDYDTYVCGVIDRAKKIIREFSLWLQKYLKL